MLTTAAPGVCSMLRRAALQVSMQPSRLVWSRDTMSSGLVLSNRASLVTHVRSNKPNNNNKQDQLCSSPVDAGCVHKVGDVSTGSVDGVKGLLHLLRPGHVTAEGFVFSYRNTAVITLTLILY